MASVYESVTNQIIKLIEEKRVLPWRKPWNVALPANAVTGRPYRGVNAVILSAMSFTDHRWLTFRQAMELGGHVRKGEKATQVTLWKFNDDGEEGEEKNRLAPLIRSYAVFNAEQCEGLDLPALPEREMAPEPLACVEALLKGYSDGPRITHGGSIACYRPVTDRVEIPSVETFSSAEAYFGTLAHELVHSTGSTRRLARRGVTDPIHFGSESYAQEELVAEIGSAFLTSEFGIDNTIEASASYIDGWLDALKRDKGLIIRAAGQAQRAADWVLGHRSSSLQSEN